MPLEKGEVRRLLRAVRAGPPERALLMLLRWSGLAMCDAMTLRRSDVDTRGELVLCRAKSGELVTVQLPGVVLETLEALPSCEGGHYFWTGKSAR